MRNWSIALAVFGLVLIGGVAEAADYYVSKSGSDGNAGTLSAPFLTINHGVSRLVAGDTLWVREGVYQETLLYNVPSGTSWSNKVRIAADPGHTVWMAPTSGSSVQVLSFAGSANYGSSGEQKYIEFDGINIDARQVGNAVKIEGAAGYNAHHIRIQNAELISRYTAVLATCQSASNIGFNEFINLRVHHSADPTLFAIPLYIQCSDNLVERCEMWDGNGGGVQIYNQYVGDAQASRNIVRNNIIRDLVLSADTRIDGIIVGRGVGNKIYNNLIYGISGPANTFGIQVYHGTDTEIYNNTVYGIGRTGIHLETGSTNAVLRNNISYGSGTAFQNNGSGTTLSNNLFDSNPLFADVSSGNFQLQAGSPAIDTGVAIGLVSQDLVGIHRPQGGAYDIGALERSSGSTGLTAPTGIHLISN